MTPEQEQRARELLNHQTTGITPQLDPASAQREAQRKLEAEARALEAQRQAEKNALTRSPAPILNAQPLQSIDPEGAHQQALKNAEAQAKAQLEALARQQRAASGAPPEKKKGKSKIAEPMAAAPAPVPLPISLSKQQRLVQLLEAYKRDQMTPAQYHQERARILAEP